MPRIRIFTAAAVAAIVASAPLTTQNATAQTVLLAGLNPPHQKMTTVHANRTIVQAKTVHKIAAHKSVAHKIAAHKSVAKIARTPAATPARATAAKDSTETRIAWPAPEQPGASDASPAAAAPGIAPATDDRPPSEMVVNGQTVPIATSDAVNDIDRAAGDQSVAATTAKPSDGADEQTAPTPVLAASVHKEASPVGSASWIAQILAALGGAIAAGAVAWFLIGSSPQRTYG